MWTFLIDSSLISPEIRTFYILEFKNMDLFYQSQVRGPEIWTFLVEYTLEVQKNVDLLN